MKKLFAIILSIVMIASFALVASADETESYTANLMFLDTTYAVGLGLETVTTPITGPGTYTLSWDLSGVTTTGILMMYVEIPEAWDKISDWTVSDVKVTVDGTDVTVDEAGVYVYEGNAYDANYNLVPTNSYIIELRNDFAGLSLSNGVGAVPADLNAAENITVTFTLTDPDAVAEEPEDEPAEEPKDEPAEEPKDEPAEEPKDEPAEEPKDEPTQDKGEEKAEDKPVPDDTNAKTGDALSVVFAMMAVSATGIAIVSKKKLF